MSAMQVLPELSESLAHELAIEVSNLAEPYRNRLVAFLKVQSHSELADLKSDLSGWLGRMKPEVMVKYYTLVRHLILDAEQVFSQELRL
jgi:hypothetical protein